MERGSTLFLRGAVALIGIAVLATCIFAIPPALVSDQTGMYKPILAGLYVTAVPFFVALYETMKLLSYIDTNTAFSDLSVTALKHIKQCAVIISLLFAAGLPYIFQTADKDDAPGVLALALIIIFTSTAIAVLTAVLQRLLKDAISMKSEIELTV